MKLGKRISLLCGSILILAVAACSAIQLLNTRGQLYHMTYQNLFQKRQALESGFLEMAAYYQDSQDSPAATRALLHYCFGKFADSGCVLVVDGETVWSETELHPEEIWPLPDEHNYGFDGWYQGKHLIVKGAFLRPNVAGYPKCWVYLIEDCTPLDAQIRYMAGTFLLIGLSCTILGLGLILLLVRRSLRPLEQLQIAAAHIAQGNYTQRAAVSSRDEVGELAESFNHMAQAVEERVTQLTETAEKQRLFIGAVTHEFKTPLTGILLNADSLQNTYLTEEEQMEALAAIETQGKWLERLVQQMLKLITIGREIPRKPFPVAELLARTAESTRDILHQRQVHLEIQKEDFQIDGDLDLLQSALVNLVDNASKASQPGQTVWLRAASNRIEVKDQGCGIPGDALPHITEAFYMADKSRSKRQGGVGLGLALVREVVSAHGARLEIQSTPGNGTTVGIQFLP